MYPLELHESPLVGLTGRELSQTTGGEGLLYQIGFLIGYGIGDLVAPLARAIYERFE